VFFRILTTAVPFLQFDFPRHKSYFYEDMKQQEDVTRSYYRPRFCKFKENHEVQGWEDRDSQLKRFQVFLDSVDVVGKSILDVGCGLGDLLAFLKDRDIAADYTGVDILPEMVRSAKDHHPGEAFHCCNIFEDNPFAKDSYDYIFCGGIFNLCMGDNLSFLRHALEVFFQVAREAVVFNLLSHTSPDQEDGYAYYDPKEVKAIVLSLGVEPEIIQGYLPNDFTVICPLQKPE
jgi:SAM-dependent methyltransferase